MDDQPSRAAAIASGGICKSPTPRYSRSAAVHCCATVPAALGLGATTGRGHAQHYRYPCPPPPTLPLRLNHIALVQSTGRLDIESEVVSGVALRHSSFFCCCLDVQHTLSCTKLVMLCLAWLGMSVGVPQQSAAVKGSMCPP